MKILVRAHKKHRRYTKRLAKKGAAVSDTAYRRACERNDSNHPRDPEQARADHNLQRQYLRQSQRAGARKAPLQPTQRAIRLSNPDAGDAAISDAEFESLATALRNGPSPEFEGQES